MYLYNCEHSPFVTHDSFTIDMYLLCGFMYGNFYDDFS